MEKIEVKKEEIDDKFDVLAEITQMDVDEDEEARLAEKAERKRLRKTMTPEEKEAQRKVNRENREKKKLKKDLNKKRKVLIFGSQCWGAYLILLLERRA